MLEGLTFSQSMFHGSLALKLLLVCVFLGPLQPPETQNLGQIFGDTHTYIDVDLCLIETVALISVLDSFLVLTVTSCDFWDCGNILHSMNFSFF